MQYCSFAPEKRLGTFKSSSFIPKNSQLWWWGKIISLKCLFLKTHISNHRWKMLSIIQDDRKWHFYVCNDDSAPITVNI